MSKFDMKNANLHSSQVGDFNTMVNNINVKIDDSEKIKSLLIELREMIVASQEIGKFDKEDALRNLKEVVERMSKPSGKQDEEGVVYYWKKLIGIIKDIRKIIPIAKSVGELLKLPPLL